MNRTEFKQIIHVVRCLNSVGYVIQQHVWYSDNSQTIFFEPSGTVDLTINPENIAKMLSNDLPSGMCVTCIRLDSVQLHIYPTKKGQN